MARGRPNHQKRAVRLVFEWCGWWWWPEEAPTPENERLCSFSGWCWQEEGSTLENERLCSSSRGVGVFEGCGCLRGVWVVVRGRFQAVLARGRPNPRERAVVLVFERCGWWCCPEKGSTPENEPLRLFLGRGGWVVVVVVVREAGGGGQRKVQP